MPELPEVETFRRVLERAATGRTVTGFENPDRYVTRPHRGREIARALAGRTFRGFERRGKLVIATLEPDGPALLLHFGMTGEPVPLAAGAPAPAFTRALLRFHGGDGVAFRDPRKLGRLRLAPSAEVPAGLGPDALGISWSAFRETLRGARGGAKAVLMDQGRLAGIGNLYSDEILHRAGIRPGRAWSSLGESDLRTLHRATRAVLGTMVRVEADWDRLPRGWLLPRRGRDGTCPRCAAPLARTAAAGRTSWYCPRCQR